MQKVLEKGVRPFSWSLVDWLNAWTREIKKSLNFEYIDEWIIVYDGSKIITNPYLFKEDNKIKELTTQKDSLKEELAGVVGVTDTGVEVRWSTVAGAKQVNKEKVEELLGYVPTIEGKESLRLSVKHNGGK